MHTDLEQVSKSSIESLKEANFLPAEDLNFLRDNSAFSQEHWEKRQIWRTPFEMETSVLNDVRFPTNAAKYWQCNREYCIFYENLVQLSFDYKETLLDIEELERDITEEKDDIEARRLEVKLERKVFDKRTHELAAKDRVRELKEWTKLIKKYDDGSFDKGYAGNHQSISQTKSDLMRAINVMQEGIKLPEAEHKNLFGRLQTSIRKVQEEGQLMHVLNGFPQDAVMHILPMIGLKELKVGDNG